MISCSRCGVALTSRLGTTMKWWSSSRLSPVYPVSKSFHTSKAFRERIKQEQQPETRLSIKKMFANEDKAKETFLEAIEYFTRQDVTHRRGHVEFIYAALKEMEPYGLNRNLNLVGGLSETKSMCRRIFDLSIILADGVLTGFPMPS
ncbi:unnamed protein product [Notodromas monacha]|uniref:ECSIT N-terminal domain-containing protein n=1 Tax=Notodromas monacha TaxID=399045 RepID=A0A7R9GEB1_9CRUS|nr:unnamed protein product [Notodromas monacha]CAG0919435.1 unnamed protein product [Notodromas monacha]